MSKYIIEIPDDVQYVLFNGKADNKYYTAVHPIAELEELNSDYINEHFGELQDEAYQAGLNDAWEAAKRIVDMPDPPYWDVFGKCKSDLFKKLSASEAIAKLKAYEDKQKDRIEVGDIVDVYGNLGVVTYMYELKACVMMTDGSSSNWNLNELKKTGKHYDIASILEAMRNTH